MTFLLTRLFPLALLTLAAGATAPSGWIFSGCMYDNKSQRALNSTFYALNTMTNEICRAYCGSNGFTYAGLEVGFQCFCGSSFLYYTVQAESNCNTPCYGDSTEMCGGSGYMTLFTLTSNDPVTGAATAGTTSTTSAAAAVAASSSSSDTAATTSSSVDALTAGTTTSGVSSLGGTQPTSSVQSVTASLGSVASSITQSGSGTTATNSTSVSFGVLSAASGTTPSGTSTTGKVVMPTMNSSGIVTAGQVRGTPRFRDGAQAVVFGKIASGSKTLRDPRNLLAVTVTVAIATLWGVTSPL